MIDSKQNKVSYVIGPDGAPLTRADLPKDSTTRWTMLRKAEVTAAIRGGLISLEEAGERYKLTVEEFLAWQKAVDKHGLDGLRVTNPPKKRR